MAQKKKAKKKTTKRDKAKFPGLEKNLFSKIKQEYFEIDYANKLSDKDKAWLAQFQDEFLGANLNENKNKKYNRKSNLHKSKKHRKSVFDANNARNRDIFSRSRAMGVLDFDITTPEEAYSPEDHIIERIDLLKEIEQAELLDKKESGSNGTSNNTDESHN